MAMTVYVSLFTAPAVYAADAPPEPVPCKSSSLLEFPRWYNGLYCIDDQPVIRKGQIMELWIVVLNIITMLIVLVGYFAVGYIIWGGFKYIKSQGDPGKIAEAKTAIIQAVAGFVIALGSVAIIRFIQGMF